MSALEKIYSTPYTVRHDQLPTKTVNGVTYSLFPAKNTTEGLVQKDINGNITGVGNPIVVDRYKAMMVRYSATAPVAYCKLNAQNVDDNLPPTFDTTAFALTDKLDSKVASYYTLNPGDNIGDLKFPLMAVAGTVISAIGADNVNIEYFLY